MDKKESSLRSPETASIGKNYVVETVPEEVVAGTSELIYVDPKKEAACRAKFDKYVVPVSVIFLVLSTLDRNNVSESLYALVFTRLDICIAWKCPSIRLRPRPWTPWRPVRQHPDTLERQHHRF